MGAPGDTPVSLSRRFLSLPAELVGCSLPPKLSGPQLGFVTLCIANILESAVNPHPLPRVSLVRARWWGEEQPGSLFRPTLLTGDGMPHVEETELAPHRAIRMKYPVCVPPEKLLEYFQDMKELTLNVIDRVTRKKYGKCTLDLVLESGNSVMTAEEKLVALRHDNVLCEIRASESGEDNNVLGYLVVDFNVQWDNAETYKWRGSATKDEMAALTSELSTDEIAPSREARSDFQRIHRLLEKGKALKRSMEVAVREKEVGDSYELDVMVGATPTKVVESIAWKDVEEARSVDQYASFGDKWNESPQVLSSSSSNSFDETQHQLQRDDETDKTSFVSTKPMHRSRNVNAMIPHGPVLKDQSTEVRDSRLLQFAVMFDSVSTSRNVEWYNGSTDSQIKRRFTIADELQSDGNVEPSHVALHYVVPPQLTRVYPTDDKFERTIRRKLKGSRWLDNAPRLWADFTGNIHVFQSSSAEDASDHFSSGYLIVETWLYTTKDTDRMLLGLSKLPLRKFAKFFRNESPELLLRGYSEQVLPFVGVEGRFAVENPFTGYRTGFLRVRVCVGTAEQFLALATTIKAIIKLQGVVRGVLYRKRFLDEQLDDNAQVPPHFETDPERKSEFVQTEQTEAYIEVVDVGCDAMEDVDVCSENHKQLDDNTQAPPDPERTSEFVQTEETETSFEVVDIGCDSMSIETIDVGCDTMSMEAVDVGCDPMSIEVGDVGCDAMSIGTVDVGCDPMSIEVGDVGCDAMSIETVDVGCDPMSIEVVDVGCDPMSIGTVDVGCDPMSIEVVDVGCDAMSIETVDVCCGATSIVKVVNVCGDAMGDVDVCSENHEQLDGNAQVPPRFETDPERKSVCVQTEETEAPIEETSAVDVGCDVMPPCFETDPERKSVCVQTEETDAPIEETSVVDVGCDVMEDVNICSAFDGCIPVSEHTLARVIGEQKSYRETGSIRRVLSISTDTKKRYSLYNTQITAKDENSSVQSLFAHDSETERIARIMQGSVNYWMKGDSSSSCDDEAGDEEETDDDYCYF